MLRPEDFFDLSGFKHRMLFAGAEYVWETLPGIKTYLSEAIQPNISVTPGGVCVVPETRVLYQGKTYDKGVVITGGDAAKGTVRASLEGEELKGAAVLYAGSVLSGGDIYIGESTVVEPGAFIRGPVIIGSNSEVRQGAYIRGNCVIGDRCVVGHTTEMKNAVMLNDAKAGHFAYIGDSILGNQVNLGAGTKCANLKITHKEVNLTIKGKNYKTGLKKFGAILGDGVETGCNSVTSPGCLLGSASLVYPNINVPGGYYPPRSIIHKNNR